MWLRRLGGLKGVVVMRDLDDEAGFLCKPDRLFRVLLLAMLLRNRTRFLYWVLCVWSLCQFALYNFLVREKFIITYFVVGID